MTPSAMAALLFAICQVETGGRWSSYNGVGHGGLQITKVVLKDVNRKYKTRYEPIHCYNKAHAENIMRLYLSIYNPKDVREAASIWRKGFTGRNTRTAREYADRVVNIAEGYEYEKRW